MLANNIFKVFHNDNWICRYSDCCKFIWNALFINLWFSPTSSLFLFNWSWANYALIKAGPFACGPLDRNKNTGHGNGSIKPLGQLQLVWYDYVREAQVYTALERPVGVVIGATGHQVTICHISKAANMLTPFPGRPPENFRRTAHSGLRNCDTIYVRSANSDAELPQLTRFCLPSWVTNGTKAWICSSQE